MKLFCGDGARVTAVTSGKGGVGKTVVSVNLAVALTRMGERAMLVDSDPLRSNAGIMLGLSPFGGESMRHRPSGLIVGRSAQGNGELDQILVDTITGLSPQTMAVLDASDRVLIVLSDEPTAFMDAYAHLKALSCAYAGGQISVVTNMVDDDRAGQRLFESFHRVVQRFNAIELTHLGSVPRDEQVRQAVFRKQSCLDAYPNSRASSAFRRIAARLAERPLAPALAARPAFAMEALHGAY
jgi:flagellar biosynthesis protein FlhG